MGDLGAYRRFGIWCWGELRADLSNLELLDGSEDLVEVGSLFNTVISVVVRFSPTALTARRRLREDRRLSGKVEHHQTGGALPGRCDHVRNVSILRRMLWNDGPWTLS